MDEGRLAPFEPLRQNVLFKVSVDGPRDVRDGIRRAPGALDGALNAVRALRDREFGVHVTTTLMQANISHLQETLRLVRDIGCSRHYVVEVAPIRHADAAMPPTTEQRHAAHAMLSAFRGLYLGGRYGLVGRLGFVDDDAFGFQCCAGTRECGVLSDGRVVGCRLLPDIVAGYIQEQPLSALWSSSEAFRYFRRDMDGHLCALCRQCPHTDVCRGGCRVSAAWRSDEEEGPDVRCPRARRARPRPPVARDGLGLPDLREAAPCSARL